MTPMEFIESEEYCAQKRLVYFGTCRISDKTSIETFAHKKAMEYYNKKYGKKQSKS